MKKAVNYFFREIKNKDFFRTIAFLLITQAIFYLSVKFLQSDYHYINSAIDNKIPFIPWFIYIYNIFYPFVFIALYYVFCKDKKKYYEGILAGSIGFLICDIIFLIYPTIMIRPDISNLKVDILTIFLLKITYLIDNPPLNCLPSIHALFSFQVIFTTIVSKNINNKNKAIIITIATLIIISTVLVKQHYFYDIIAALEVCSFANTLVYIKTKI